LNISNLVFIGEFINNPRHGSRTASGLLAGIESVCDHLGCL
jgi:hypothetical protein